MKNTNIRFRINSIAFCALALFAASGANADVKLPAMFTDHAVLQRDTSVPVWGWADPDEVVTVSIADQTYKVKSNKDGKWLVKLTPLKVGKSLTLEVEGKNRLTREDI